MGHALEVSATPALRLVGSAADAAGLPAQPSTVCAEGFKKSQVKGLGVLGISFFPNKESQGKRLYLRLYGYSPFLMA